MSYYFWSAIINAITSLFAATFVRCKSKPTDLSIRFIFFALSVAFWAIGYSFWIAAMPLPSPLPALYWIRLAMVGSTLIPLAFTEFVLELIGKSHKQILLRWINTICCIAILIFSFNPLFIKTVSSVTTFTYWPVPGPFFYFFHAWFGINIFFSHFWLFRYAIIVKDKLEKKRAIAISIGTLIGFVGGMTNHFLWYGVKVPPVGNILVSVYVGTIAYSVVRHRFLDIEVIIKRTVVFAGLLAMVMAVVAVMSALVNGFISRWFAVSQSVVAVGSSLGVIALFDPVRKILVNWTDRFLFQKNEDFKVALNRLSRSIVSILEIDKIAKTILSTLDQTLRLETVAILIKDESGKEYRILDSFGLESFGKCIVSDHIMIQYLIGQSEIINLEDAETAKSLPLEITDTMAEFKAVLAIPLRVEGDLVGLLFWGKKKSDQEFTQDELSFLPAVAAQVAIALSYARAIDILKKSQIDFAQQSKLAALGTLSAGISHEIKNPMNQIGMAVSMLKFKEKNNLYAGASPEEFKKEVFESLERVENDVKRVNDIVERLSAFAKKPKEVKLEDIHVAETVDGVLAIVGAEFRNHQIQIVKHYELDVPLIRADYHAIEEVMLNLLVNAQHAIKEKGTGQGVVRIDIKSRPQEVEVSVRDSGVGIPAENLEKIFDPFFTTKDVSRNPDPNAIKGTGLGLHLIREILKRYGGRILVESVVGEGTVFRVLFPC